MWKVAYDDNPSKATNPTFQFLKTAALLFLQFHRTQRAILFFKYLTDYTNQLQTNSFLTYHSNKSNDQAFVLQAITTTVFALWRHSLVPLNISDANSLDSTDKKLFERNTCTHFTANPSHTLVQPYAAPNIGISANLSSSHCVLTVNPRSPPSAMEQIYSIPFVAMNKSVKNLDGFDR